MGRRRGGGGRGHVQGRRSVKPGLGIRESGFGKKADPDPPANVRINLRPRESGVVAFLVPEHGQAGDEVPPWPFPISNTDSPIPALSLRLVPLPPPRLPTPTPPPPPTPRPPHPPPTGRAHRTPH